jgi:AbrB family looped-hinge helix DNA binding protein
MRIKIDKAGRVILPKPVRDRLGLHAGSDLDIQETPERLVLGTRDRKRPCSLRYSTIFSAVFSLIPATIAKQRPGSRVEIHSEAVHARLHCALQARPQLLLIDVLLALGIQDAVSAAGPVRIRGPARDPPYSPSRVSHSLVRRSAGNANVSSTPPDGMVTYWRPSTMYVMGAVLMAEPVLTFHRFFPLFASKAMK